MALLRASPELWPFLTRCFADRAYRGERVGKATAITVEIVEPEKVRPASPSGHAAGSSS